MTLSSAGTCTLGSLGLVHGLLVRSQVPLSNTAPVANRRLPNVTICVQGHLAERLRASSTPMAAMGDGPHRYDVFRSTDGSYRVTVPFVLAADIDATGTNVIVTASPGADGDVISLVTSGLLLAVVLAVRGEPLLHASAVESDGRALAIAGPSGRGKSTLAAMMVAAGGKLVSDDHLRAVVDSSGARCWRSAVTVRARDGGLGPAMAAVLGARRRATDGRLLLDTAVSDRDPSRLTGLVIPLPDPEVDAVQVEPLRGAPAVGAILASRALPGQLCPDWERALLDHAVDVVSAVPVWAARIPWRADRVRRTGQELLELLQWEDRVGYC